MVVDLVMEISMKTKVVILTHVVSINTVLTLSIYAQKIKIEKTKINKKMFSNVRKQPPEVFNKKNISKRLVLNVLLRLQ